MLFGPNYRDPNGQVTASASINSSALQLGDCILNISDSPSSISKLTVVPCTSPHEAEVFAVGTGLSNDDATLQSYCTGQYEGYMGIAWSDASLQATYIHADSTKATTDVQCIVYKAGQMVSDTYKGSGQ